MVMYILFTNVYFACVLTISRFSAAALLAPGTLRTPAIYGLCVNLLPQAVAIAALVPLQRYTIRREFYLYPPRFYWFFIYFVYIALYFGVIYITDTLIPRRLVTGLSILLQCVLLLVIVVVYTNINTSKSDTKNGFRTNKTRATTP